MNVIRVCSRKLCGIWAAQQTENDAHRGDGKPFVVRADEKLSAFAELESLRHVSGEARHKSSLTDLRGFLYNRFN